MIEQQSPKDKLTNELEGIKCWKKLSEMEKRRAIGRFMDSMGHLYLNYFQNHIEEAKASASTQETLLKSELKNIYNFYVLELASDLYGEDALADLWETACWGRTNIEAFNAMFGESAGNLDIRHIATYMKNKLGGVGLYPDQIPKNAPKSHWWWYAEYGKYS